MWTLSTRMINVAFILTELFLLTALLKLQFHRARSISLCSLQPWPAPLFEYITHFRILVIVLWYLVRVSSSLPPFLIPHLPPLPTVKKIRFGFFSKIHSLNNPTSEFTVVGFVHVINNLFTYFEILILPYALHRHGCYLGLCFFRQSCVVFYVWVLDNYASVQR